MESDPEQANPIWPVRTRFPSLKRDLRKDVLVVGGGMAGVSSAFQLKKAGYALIERAEVGGPATGASSGVLYYGSGTNYIPAVELFGESNANLLWKETEQVIREIVAVAEKERIDCGLRTCGAIMVARTDDEVAELEPEQKGMSRLGLPTKLLSSSELKDFFPLREFREGISYDGVGQVHPGRLAAGIINSAGLEVYEGTPSNGWEEVDGGVSLETPGGRVRASNLVLATNTEACVGLENHFDVESSVILASQPTDKVVTAFPAEKIIWTMDEKYDIVYPRGDRLILELYALGEETEKLAYYYPGIDFNIEHQWGEVWAKAPDWLPALGKVRDHVAVAVGMGDQGIIMSWLSGSKMPGVLEGKEDWFTTISSPNRFST